MPLQVSWTDVLIRVALTMLAGALIGFNRGARGHAAGFRTTILVGLAAAVAMIQANLLLPVSGKSADSFAVLDLMRLPLGILTGVGFIGGGSILKKGDLVIGVTTAATLWVMTVIGLCFGGGQLALGAVATGLAVITLGALKWVDATIPREHRALLVITCRSRWDVVEDLPKALKPFHVRARFQKCKDDSASSTTDYAFELSWRLPERADPPFELLQTIEQTYRVKSFQITSENGR